MQDDSLSEMTSSIAESGERSLQERDGYNTDSAILESDFDDDEERYVYLVCATTSSLGGYSSFDLLRMEERVARLRQQILDAGAQKVP